MHKYIQSAASRQEHSEVQPNRLSVGYKHEADELRKEETNFKRLTPQQVENIKWRLQQGESPTTLAEWLNVAPVTVYSIAWKYNISLTENREWSDNEIIFGRRFKSSGRERKGFPDLDEESKLNYSHLIKKHDSLINWCINKYMQYVPDFDEIKQIILLRIYYQYKEYSPAKGTFSNWLVLTAKATILLYLNRIYAIKKDRTLLSLSDFEGFDLVDDTNYDTYTDDQIESLTNAINDLPEKYRTMINLYMKGYTKSAIAVHMGITAQTVRHGVEYIKQSILECKDKYFTSGVYVSPKKMDLLKKKDGDNIYETALKNKQFEIEREKRLEEYKNSPLVKYGLRITQKVLDNILSDLPHETIETLVDKYRIGYYTIKKISQIFKIDPITAAQKRNALTPQQIEEIKGLLVSEFPSEIADRYGVSTTAISKIKKQYNIKTACDGPGNRLSDKQLEDAIDLIKNSNLSFKRIAEIIGCSDMSITNIAKKHNIDVAKRNVVVSGEKFGTSANAVLSDDVVRSIKFDIVNTNLSLGAIATKHKLTSRYFVYDIHKGVAYKNVHVDGFYPLMRTELKTENKSCL